MKFKVISFSSLLVLSLQSCLPSSDQKPTTKAIVTKAESYKLRGSDLPFEAYVPYTGVPFREGGKTYLSYELNLLNSYQSGMRLTEVSIRDIKNPEIVYQKYDSIYFDTYFEQPGKEVEVGNHEIAPSAFGVLYIDIPFADSAPLPESLFHRIKLEVLLPKGETIQTGVEAAVIEVPALTTTVLQPPFRNGKWMYAATHHRDTRSVFDGGVHITQRHAIDWIALNDNGDYVTDDRTKNEYWVAYGKEILAMADGTILSVKDSIPENVPGADEMAVRITRKNLGGNWVLLNIGNNQEVFYAHLIPGSLRVKAGDSVKTGDVLGLLGNSGNSDCPHLHMHLETDAGGVMKGEGLPFHFPNFEQLDQFSEIYMNDSVWTKNKWIPSGKFQPTLRKNEYPRGEGVVEFK